MSKKKSQIHRHSGRRIEKPKLQMAPIPQEGEIPEGKIPRRPPKRAKKKFAAKKELTIKQRNHIIINKSDDKRARWYVIHTYSGHENKVANALCQRIDTMNLKDKVLELLIPTQEKIQIRQGQKLKVTERIFPGYLLVKMIMEDSSWLAVRTTQGVTGFLGVGNKPTPISTKEVGVIMKFAQLKAPKFKAKFSLGEAVKIIDGPFAEFLGSVDYIDEDRGKIRVLVSIFGRETPVELDFLQISKI
jgi:transcriptional antiterminator NusG